tara:strand:- start:10346 stop:11608 length:1263 start_codon:yes stop_codon:yes gene_type:complete
MLNKIFYSFLSIVFISSFQIIALLISSQKATPEELGLLTMLISINAFIFLFVDFGLSNYFLYKKNLDRESTKEVKRINFIISLFVLFIILLSGVCLFFMGYSAVFYASAILTGINSIFLSKSRIERVQLQNQDDFKRIFSLDFYSRFFGIAILLFLNYLTNINVVIIYLISILSVNLFAWVLVFRIEKKGVFTYGHSKNSNIVNFCLPQGSNSVINFLSQNIDLFIIASVAGLHVSGVYGVIKIVSTKALQLYMPTLLKVYTPLIIKEDNSEASYLKLIFVISMVSSVTYSLFIIFDEFILFNIFNLDDSKIVLSAFSFYCLYSYLRSICMPIGILVTKSGKTIIGLYYTLAQLIVLSVVLFIFSDNLVQITFSLFIYQLILLIPHWHFLMKRYLKLRFLSYHFYALLPLTFPLALMEFK